MKNKLLTLANNLVLRVFAKADEENVLYNSAPINEFEIFEAGQTLAEKQLFWIPKDDLEIIGIWISLTPGYDPDSTLTFLVNSQAATAWTLILPFSSLTILGSAGSLIFPPASLVREGWGVVIKPGSNIEGLNVISRHCRINPSIPALPMPNL